MLYIQIHSSAGIQPYLNDGLIKILNKKLALIRYIKNLKKYRARAIFDKK